MNKVTFLLCSIVIFLGFSFFFCGSLRCGNATRAEFAGGSRPSPESPGPFASGRSWVGHVACPCTRLLCASLPVRRSPLTLMRLVNSVVILKHTRRDSLFGTCPPRAWTLWAARLEVKDAHATCARTLSTHLASRGSVYTSCPRSSSLHPCVARLRPRICQKHQPHDTYHTRKHNYVVVAGGCCIIFGMIIFCVSVSCTLVARPTSIIPKPSEAGRAEPSHARPGQAEPSGAMLIPAMPSDPVCSPLSPCTGAIRVALSSSQIPGRLRARAIIITCTTSTILG